MGKMQGGRNKHLTYECRLCGAEVSLLGYVMKHDFTQTMLQDHLCSHCVYLQWVKDFLSNANEYEIINGEVLIPGEKSIGTKSPKINRKYFIGKGNRFTSLPFPQVAFLIPSEIRDLYPDTAIVVPYNTWRRMQAYGNLKCRAIGCFDRYHCFWYNAQEMEKNGPWNSVPDDHIIGDEACEAFLDKCSMYNINQ